MFVFFKELLFCHSFCTSLFVFLLTQCQHEQGEGVVRQKAVGHGQNEGD